MCNGRLMGRIEFLEVTTVLFYLIEGFSDATKQIVPAIYERFFAATTCSFGDALTCLIFIRCVSRNILYHIRTFCRQSLLVDNSRTTLGLIW